jgi:hypothetical protein
VNATARWRYCVNLGLVIPILVTVLAGCGANSQVRIPRASLTPGTKTVELAPGVRVKKAQLALPSYSVSTSYPLPSGVSAKTVVEDVQIDDLIENVAIERQQPALLKYADSGDWLASEQGEISQNKKVGTVVLSIVDRFTSISVGFRTDPNDSGASAAVILQGIETRRQRSGQGVDSEKSTTFDVLQWLVWAPSLKRYLTCDTASS